MTVFEGTIVIIGSLLTLIGIIGSVLPIIPGVISGWIALFLLKITNLSTFSWKFIVMMALLGLLTMLVDYFFTLWGVKRFGGTRYGIIGALSGLLIGVFIFPPFGIIIGPFLGAYFGELIRNRSQNAKALRAAFGSTIGFLLGTVLNISVSIIFAFIYFKEIIKLFTL